MRLTTLSFVALSLVIAGASASQISRAPGAPGAPTDASAQRYEQARNDLIAKSLKVMETGDPLETAILLQGAIERVGKHPDLVDALETVKPHAAEAAEARVDRMLREGKTREAVSLLARVSAATHSPRLDALLDRATLDLRLLEAAEFEASGDRLLAMQAAASAVLLAPDDPRVRVAAERHGLRTAPAQASAPLSPPAPAPTAQTPVVSPAPQRDAGVDARLEWLEQQVRRMGESPRTAPTDQMGVRLDQRLDQLDTALRRQMGDLDRVTRLVEEMNSRQRLDGRAEFATTELDRRVRELERVNSALQREVSSLSNEVRSLQRSVGRP